MKIITEINPPMMPNFISMKITIGQRQDGFKPVPQIAVSDLSEEQAEEYAELMRKTFLIHWANKVAAKNAKG
jgi:hypothetical protein